MVPESNDITRVVPQAAELPSGGAPDAPPPAPAAPAAAAHDEHLGNGSTTGDSPESASAAPSDAPTPAGSDPPPAQESPGEPATATSSEPGAATTPSEKKRRRRRRGKRRDANGAKPEGAPAEGAEAADHPGDVATAETSGGEPSPTAPDDPMSGRSGSPPADATKNPSRSKRPPAKGKKPKKPREGAPHQRERTAFHVGEEVFGRVTSVTEHAIMVDLSGKALAIFDRHELAEDDLVPEVGDRFVAHVHGDGSRGGLVVLTRKPLREEETKPRIEAAATSGEPISGLVTGTVKGGIEVDVDGLRAFAPGSHVELRPGADLAHLIGRRLEFTVAQYAKRGRDVVVSRKSYIEAEAKEQRKASLGKLEIGAVVKGIVRSVVQYGAFIAIPSADDVEGLVHMTEASHDRNAKLTDVFRPGEEIDVKVLRVDDKGKLWLSHRAAVLDPWQEAMKTYSQGTRHKGKVMRLLPFGAFIELAPGVEGLLHTADLSYKRIEHPNEILKEQQEIDVVVADLDKSSHKIGLHLAPPEGEEAEARQKIVPHKVVKVAVVAAESAGLVVRVLGVTGRQGRGFIPAGHTGTERGTDLRKHFPAGMRLEAKVIEIDPRRGEAKLSLRAFKEDNEKAAYNEYRASVAKASKFGTLGDLLAKKKVN